MIDRRPYPVTGAWRPGDDPGLRRFLTIAVDRPFVLERRAAARRRHRLRDAGASSTPTAANAVLVCHALTGDSHAAGPRRAAATRRPAGGTASSGPAWPLDTDRYFVVCANVLGGCQGTTGPASPDPADRPAVRLDASRS